MEIRNEKTPAEQPESDTPASADADARPRRPGLAAAELDEVSGGFPGFRGGVRVAAGDVTG